MLPKDAPRLHASGIRNDVDILRIDKHVNDFLLLFQNMTILLERLGYFRMNSLGDSRIICRKVPPDCPEVMRLRFSRGGHRIHDPHPNAADPLAFGRTGPGERPADMDDNETRRLEIDDLPSVDPILLRENSSLQVGWRRCTVDDPARQPNAFFGTFGLHVRFAAHLCRADRRAVDVTDVAEIHQVVVDQFKVGLDDDGGSGRGKGRVSDTRKVGNSFRIRKCAFSHPDPYPIVALNDRVRFDSRFGRYLVLAGDERADSIAAERQAMIPALQVVSHQSAQVQRRMAMRAAVFKRYRIPALLAIKHNWLAKDRAGE